MMANLSPEAAFKAEGVLEGEVTKVAVELLARTGCTSIKQFVGYFGAREDLIVSFWEAAPGWPRGGALLAHMRMALINLVDAAKKSRDQEDTLLDMTLDNAIDPRTNKSLTGVWEIQYGFRLHPTQDRHTDLGRHVAKAADETKTGRTGQGPPHAGIQRRDRAP